MLQFVGELTGSDVSNERIVFETSESFRRYTVLWNMQMNFCYWLRKRRCYRS